MFPAAAASLVCPHVGDNVFKIILFTAVMLDEGKGKKE